MFGVYVRDFVVALCVSILVVPSASVAHAMQSEPMQHEAATTADFEEAFKAIFVGATAEQALLENDAPLRTTLAFGFDLYETLFGQNWEWSDAWYFLNAEGNPDLAAGQPSLVDGQTPDGNVFFLDIAEIVEGDLSELSAAQQADVSAAWFERCWTVVGTLGSALADVEVVGTVIQVMEADVRRWLFVPFANVNGSLLVSVVSSSASDSDNGQTPAPGGSTCLQGCEIQKDACDAIANINYASCAGQVSARLTAALAACVVASVGFAFANLIAGLGVGAVCVVTAVAWAAGEYTACSVAQQAALAICKIEDKACRDQCCLLDPADCTK